MPSALSLITALPMDVRHMASLETAIILGTATGVTLALRAHDSSIVSQMEGRMESFLSGGRIAGDLSVQVAASLAVFTAGRIAESPRTAAVGADLVRAQLLNAAFTHATKALVDRRRPDGGPYSFPSGHASATFAAAAVLERHFGWKVGVPAYALGVYTSVSRLTAYQHYPGDVIMGAAIGAVIGRSVSVGRARRAVQVVPVVLHDGVAIQFNMWGSPVASADVR
jgi:membrane-associated phospholipid phosphatase